MRVALTPIPALMRNDDAKGLILYLNMDDTGYEGIISEFTRRRL